MDVDFLRVGAHLKLKPYIMCKRPGKNATWADDHLGPRWIRAALPKGNK